MASKKKTTKIPSKKGRPLAGDLDKAKKVAKVLDTAAVVAAEKDDPYQGLSDRQRTIARMRLRGLSQVAIAKFMNVSQPVISKEVKRIREHMHERGTEIDQASTIGETATLFEEVEYRAWELYHSGDDATKAKALSLVMTSREKHIKLLMDVGRLEKAGSKSTVEVTVSPLVRQWDDTKRSEVVQAVINTTLNQLPEPEPPEDDVEDVDFSVESN